MLYPDGTRYSSLSAPDFMSMRADTACLRAGRSARHASLTIARRRRAARNQRRICERRRLRHARTAGRDRARLPHGRESTRPDQRHDPQSRVLAARVRRRWRGARPHRSRAAASPTRSSASRRLNRSCSRPGRCVSSRSRSTRPSTHRPRSGRRSSSCRCWRGPRPASPRPRSTSDLKRDRHAAGEDVSGNQRRADDLASKPLAK